MVRKFSKMFFFLKKKRAFLQNLRGGEHFSLHFPIEFEMA